MALKPQSHVIQPFVRLEWIVMIHFKRECWAFRGGSWATPVDSHPGLDRMGGDSYLLTIFSWILDPVQCLEGHAVQTCVASIKEAIE